MHRVIVSLVVFLGTAPSALAHAGHLIDLAGHDHIVAGAALGIAILIGLAGALKGEDEPEEASEAEHEPAHEPAEA